MRAAPCYALPCHEGPGSGAARPRGGLLASPLGGLAAGGALPDLLIEAIRYVERPDVRARLEEVIDAHVGDGIGALIAAETLASEVLSEAYRLYAICERRGWAEDALGFNALVTSWPEILRRAGSPGSVQPELGL